MSTHTNEVLKINMILNNYTGSLEYDYIIAIEGSFWHKDLFVVHISKIIQDLQKQRTNLQKMGTLLPRTLGAAPAIKSQHYEQSR